MSRLTDFHKTGLEIIYFLFVAVPKQLSITVASLLLMIYVVLIAIPTYILFGYDLHKEMEDLLRVEK